MFIAKLSSRPISLKLLGLNTGKHYPLNLSDFMFYVPP